MAEAFRAHGIVCRRTKLGETDLILTVLTDAGRQVRAVAKGARRPASRLAAGANLGNEVELLLRPGRSLDTVLEARLLTARASLALQVERLVMAEAVLDAAADLTAEGEHDARLLPLTTTALDAVAELAVDRLALAGAAYVLKAAAMQGFRPALDECVCCGEPLDADVRGTVAFSFAEGGAVCAACAAEGAATPGAAAPVQVDAAVLAWSRALLAARFAELAGEAFAPCAGPFGWKLLDFARRWIEFYPGVQPRALVFALEVALA
jgi:DNA repair protein RecO (recombination protein O)